MFTLWRPTNSQTPVPVHAEGKVREPLLCAFCGKIRPEWPPSDPLWKLCLECRDYHRDRNPKGGLSAGAAFEPLEEEAEMCMAVGRG